MASEEKPERHHFYPAQDAEKEKQRTLKKDEAKDQRDAERKTQRAPQTEGATNRGRMKQRTHETEDA